MPQIFISRHHCFIHTFEQIESGICLLELMGIGDWRVVSIQFSTDTPHYTFSSKFPFASSSCLSSFITTTTTTKKFSCRISPTVFSHALNCCCYISRKMTYHLLMRDRFGFGDGGGGGHSCATVVCKSTRLGTILYSKRDRFRATNTHCWCELCMMMLMLVQLQTVL